MKLWRSEQAKSTNPLENELNQHILAYLSGGARTPTNVWWAIHHGPMNDLSPGAAHRALRELEKAGILCAYWRDGAVRAEPEYVYAIAKAEQG